MRNLSIIFFKGDCPHFVRLANSLLMCISEAKFEFRTILLQNFKFITKNIFIISELFTVPFACHLRAIYANS